jgi:hypothetical protein
MEVVERRRRIYNNQLPLKTILRQPVRKRSPPRTRRRIKRSQSHLLIQMDLSQQIPME